MPKQSKPKLSHYDSAGRARMVDVGAKQSTKRTATASAFVELSAAVLAALPQNPKGNPLEVARFAGIQAAKRTSELIPMCHPLPLTHVDVEAEVAPAAFASARPPPLPGNGRRDGGPHRRLSSRPHRLRHDQGPGQIHRHPQHSARTKIRRQIRQLHSPKMTQYSSFRIPRDIRRLK